MTPIWEQFHQLEFSTTLRALMLLIIGFFLARLLSGSAIKLFKKHISVHQGILFSRVIFYFIFILFFISAVEQLGFSIGTLLGATGIITVAIGIASQTSMSNIISGLFIIGEKPFEVGDTIIVNDLEGEVLSIDLLSIRIKTNENMMVRIPNEMLVKSPIKNTSYFPIRRADFFFNIAYKENLQKIRELILNVIKNNGLCLEDPEPQMYVNQLNDASVSLKVSVWCRNKDLNALKSNLQEEIKIAFSANNIEWPLLLKSIYIQDQKSL